MRDSDGPDLVIGGTPRSGTTLLQRIVSELDDVYIPPESHIPRVLMLHLLRSYSFPVTPDRLRHALTQYNERGYLDFDVSEVVGSLPDPCPSPFVVFRAIVQACAGSTGIVGDKTPSNLRWWRLTSAPASSTRYLFVVRHPAAVVTSLARVPWAPGSIDALARRWADDQSELRRARNALGERCLIIRYEDLVLRNHDVRAKVEAHLGRSTRGHLGQVYEGRPLARPEERWRHAASGRIDSARVDAWKAEISPDAYRKVARVCSFEASRWGYQLECSRPRRTVVDLLRSSALRTASRALGSGVRRRLGASPVSRTLGRLELDFGKWLFDVT